MGTAFFVTSAIHVMDGGITNAEGEEKTSAQVSSFATRSPSLPVSLYVERNGSKIYSFPSFVRVVTPIPLC